MTPSHFNTYQSSYNNPQFQQQISPSQSPQYGSIHPTQHYLTTYPSTPFAITYPSAPYPNVYSSTIHQDAYSGLAVPVFKQGNESIDAINKMMSFLSIVVTSRFPATNNQLRNSFNLRQQATIHDGRVTIQPIHGRQSSFAAGTSGTRANISRTGGNNLGQQRVVKCFNYQGEGHMARQCPKPKRKRDVTWFRDKVLLVEAQRSDDLDAYDSDCDKISTAKAVLMANLSSYGSDVLSENEITSDSNIIPYSQYLLETQNAAVENTNYSTQQDAMILSVFEQLSNQVTNYNKVNKDNLMANESLSAELERYIERVKLLEERQNVDLSTREKFIIDDIIQDKNAQFADFEKSLTTTFNVLENESKEKEAKNIDKEIALEKKVK
ncbi:copia protein [Tanacetum coccineum]